MTEKYIPEKRRIIISGWNEFVKCVLKLKHPVLPSGTFYGHKSRPVSWLKLHFTHLPSHSVCWRISGAVRFSSAITVAGQWRIFTALPVTEILL